MKLLKKIEEHRERTASKRKFKKAKKKTELAAAMFLFMPLWKKIENEA